tara:strand:- start:1956 stop:3641 length:1686 start_codon:yes stop_codon:yes gene_type:complete
MLTPEHAQEIVAAHDDYWNDKRPRMRELRSMYFTRFWSDREYDANDGILRTEVPKAYAVVESYLGSLYARNPAVFVQPDLRDRGNPEVAAATANQYLLNVRNVVEDATRLALIYPCAFVKLAPVESVDPLKRVASSALEPWQVIVDDTSGSWEHQRYVGHSYLLPLDEAAARFDKAPEDFTPRAYSRWIDTRRTTSPGDNNDDTELGKWVRVVELYDLVDDALLVWSPDFESGTEFVFEGVTVQVGALDPDVTEGEEVPDPDFEHEKTGIPYKSASGRPVVPIVPLYFSRDPGVPLRGYSLVDRSYDQFRELNVMRTYQAQGVRRMARQWLMRAGFMDESAVAKLAAGKDGEVIEVDVQPGMPLEGNIISAPQAPIPADITLYAQTVENDIREAGLLAPFTRGEVSRTTATEANLLQSYTSSELGRMARQRDSVITSIARTYNIMLSVILGDEAEPLALPNPVGPTMLSADDLTGDFKYWAVDAGSTPAGDMAKRQSLVELAPLLLQLGTQGASLLSEVVRTFQLPEELGEVAPQPAEPLAPEAPGAQALEGAPPPLSIVE